jgi:hypothetical protein
MSEAGSFRIARFVCTVPATRLRENQGIARKAMRDDVFLSQFFAIHSAIDAMPYRRISLGWGGDFDGSLDKDHG